MKIFILSVIVSIGWSYPSQGHMLIPGFGLTLHSQSTSLSRLLSFADTPNAIPLNPENPRVRDQYFSRA